MSVVRSAAALTAAIAVAACSVTPAPRTSGPVPLVSADAASFAPLVPTSATESSCVQPSGAPLPPGGRAVAMRYSGPPHRQVTVTLDGDGNPIKYLDVRGDLSENDGDAGNRTTIGLFLEQGYAVLSNRSAAEAPVMLEVPVDDVVSSSRLGNPREVMHEVLESCDRIN
ncbi:MAG: hypothetical protein HKN72_07400 [Gemmatimonadetes bacterium]|nr:hypothetical protein [Gemmatimonadota bacterium]NNF13030.1 hypothetical protein [Gemmatimonadota bacterium]